MYRRAQRSAAAALATVLAAFVLFGCSSQAAQPMATLGGGTPVTAPGATAVPSVVATLGSGFSVDVEMNATGTKDQITILNQAKALILAYEKAIEADDPKDPTYQSMVIGRGLSSLYQSVSTYKSASQKPIGTDVFYQFDASVTPKLGADVEFCEDQSREQLVNSATGAVVAAGDKAKQYWDFGFNANSNGTWTIAYATSQAAGSTQCT